jgi:hypothetical protein
MLNLFKLIAKIKRHYNKRPPGIWMPPPEDCILVSYHTTRDGIQTVSTFHDPFVCNGECSRGWKYGLLDQEDNSI